MGEPLLAKLCRSTISAIGNCFCGVGDSLTVVGDWPTTMGGQLFPEGGGGGCDSHFQTQTPRERQRERERERESEREIDMHTHQLP
jgi:hypothetical protein